MRKLAVDFGKEREYYPRQMSEVITEAPNEKVTMAELEAQGFKLFKPDFKEIDMLRAPELTKGFDSFFKDRDAPCFKIVLDLGAVTYMSVAGFRSLSLTQREAKRYGRGEIILANVPEKIRKKFELTGFSELFQQIELVEG